MFDVEKNRRFYDSLKSHQIRCKQGFALPVTLTGSDNEYLRYPVRGVIYVFEQGTNLGVTQGVFHCQNEDGSLGAPVTVRNATFEYSPKNT